MDGFSLSGLLSSFIFGVIGFWLIQEGRRKLIYSLSVIGMIMIAYPYFTRGPLLDWSVGVILCVAAYYIGYK